MTAYVINFQPKTASSCQLEHNCCTTKNIALFYYFNFSLLAYKLNIISQKILLNNIFLILKMMIGLFYQLWPKTAHSCVSLLLCCSDLWQFLCL